MSNPILVERYRDKVLESFHRGVICLVDRDNRIVFSVGDVEQLCFPRSALKLTQIIPLLESGACEKYNFTVEEIAIMCGSHNGEKEHLRVVNSILHKIGMSKDQLKCGAQYPTLNEDRNTLIKSDIAPEQIHNNCSGKHAGFLALCKFLDLDPETYFRPEHPIQQMIKKVTAELHEYPEDKMTTAMDGCSAPIFSIPVYNQAIAYKNLTDPSQFSPSRQKAIHKVVEAVTSYPYMIAGKDRYCTELMQICGKRVFGKTGADGIFSIGFIEEKFGCCIKIDDGLMGPQYGVAQSLMEKTGIFSQEQLKSLHHYAEEPIRNWNKFDTGINKVNESILSEFASNFQTVHH
jgi:L-asparaginase II